MPRAPRAGAPAAAADPLAGFSPATRAWFTAAFAGATPPQAEGWPAIAAGGHALLCAPTGSGKTLAAFLWCLDRLVAEPPPTDPALRLRVLYVSPLKALVHDVDRNLRAPLAGIALAAERLGLPAAEVRIGMRTGDTPADERRAFAKAPPDILVTTPESLYLLLTSAARAALRGVRWVIVDEIHALAGTKRGAHLALSLERLAALTEVPPQRIGLSATARPLTTVAAFLGGREDVAPDAPDAAGEGAAGAAADAPDPGPDADPVAATLAPPRVPAGRPRPVTIVDTGVRKPLELEVIVPVEDLGRIGEPLPLDEAPGGPASGPEARTSIWPQVWPRLLERIRAHRSTIVFVNSRRLAERLARTLNEIAGEEIVLAHHGSLAREQRLLVEDALKAGRIPAIAATSSLELGIDMGAVDLVVQVGSPLSVARGLQRVGRAGHSVGAASRGVIFPRHRGDLLECAVVAERMHAGAIEAVAIPRSPLDVLAQQVVAIAAEGTWRTDALLALVRRAEPYAELGAETFEGVLEMLAGAYPSDEFAELRPRIVRDRAAGTVTARRDARMVAVISGGTIPDRGLFPVYLAEDGEAAGAGQPPGTRARAARTGGRRVGELDEEMVYETRPGEIILLGASAWRVESIGHDRVLVSPAPGQPGKIPFWRGDSPGRPIELGREIGRATRELADGLAGGVRGRAAVLARLHDTHDLDARAATNLVAYLDEERAATGTLTTDRPVVDERCRDELGDWRICLLTPFGARVHAPWALAIEARLRERLGIEVQPIWSDDGIVIRLPATEPALAGGDPGATGMPDAPEDALLPAADDIEELVIGALGSSALFASRFRENAARALLLPRRRPGLRTPLWQMRRRSAQLLAVASRYGSFPIILETYRECLSDVFDLPALTGILRAIERREIRVVHVETRSASPFASSLLFDYIAAYMYEGDAPALDRRAQALALDRDLLRELLGADELRELLDPDALAELELELAGLAPERAVTSADGLHDLLRRLGDLDADEVAARVAGADATARAATAADWLAALTADRRAARVRIAGEERWIAAEDAGRFRDAAGVVPPAGIPDAFLVPARDALGGLLARYARHHGPFLSDAPAARWGLPRGIVEDAAERLLASGVLVRGELRPGGVTREWCDPEVLRLLRRRSLARLRREIEPVEPAALGRFLPAWHGIGGAAGGPDRLAEVIGLLEGVPLAASVLERDILPARVRGYQPRLLDALGAAGEVAWIGAGSLGRDDGRVILVRPDRLALVAPADDAAAAAIGDPDGEGRLRAAIHAHLAARGAAFWREILVAGMRAHARTGLRAPTERELLDALWELVWAGLVTNDTFAPLRALRWKRPGRDRPAARPRLGAAGRMGPPEGTGRWSLVAEGVETAVALAGGRAPNPTERRHALALRLLERHGIVTRDGVAAEGTPGGFGAVYPVLRELEERGRIRRGYFIEGLGGAQFALPGAVDRLRALRADAGGAPVPDAGRVRLLAATDPANPWGAALPWPRRDGAEGRPPGRAAGSWVVLVDGAPAAVLERAGRALVTLLAADDPVVADAVCAALPELVADGRLRELRVERIDGTAVGEHPFRDRLAAAGWRAGYHGWSPPGPTAPVRRVRDDDRDV
ncbi:MAG: DEAD/DEAH box helicase [Chloroflexota bacterium]